MEIRRQQSEIVMQMEIGKQQSETEMRQLPRDLNIWLCGRLTDIGVIGLRVGVANSFWLNR